MSKIENIIKLINLLTYRQEVTLETVMSTCNIPERTAYRYLNTISEANIPVYYDKERHAYRLNRTRSMLINNIDLGDALIISLALRLLATHVNEEYRDDINALVAQLLIRQPCPLEDVMETFESTIRQHKGETDYSELVSSMLLHAAILCSRQVMLTTGNGVPGERREVRFDQPRLKFSRHWQVVEAEQGDGAETSLSSVRKVSIQ